MTKQEIESLYKKHGGMIFRRCLQLLKDKEEAYDSMQETFSKLLEKRKVLTSDYPWTLLYRMATNICLNKIRSHKNAKKLHPEDLVFTIAHFKDQGRGFEVKSILKKLFGLHKESTRVIAMLHYYDGLTLQEVANEVGLSISGVRHRLNALRTSLKKMEVL